MVYLTLQKDYGARKSSYNKTVAIQKCGDFPYEITLRFASCVLRCGPCFAAGYSWKDKFLDNRRVRAGIPLARLIEDFTNIPRPSIGSYNWMRILGGEPLLSDEYIEYLFDFIIEVSTTDPAKFNNGIVIQTNGIHIGRGHTAVISDKLSQLYQANPSVIVTIETSIKGTNPEEFHLVARTDQALYKYNIRSYFNLLDLDLPNLRPVVIAGFGVNESFLLKEGRSKYRITILLDPNTPIYHPENWDDDFTRLYNDFTQQYTHLYPPFERMPMYGIKDQFQYGWVRPAIDRAKQIYGDRWYDAHNVALRNPSVEDKFNDILDKFFLRSNQEYYSALISKH